MDFNTVVKERRSIRKFDAEKKVTPEQIAEMVQAAIYAPSWKNAQTSRYYACMSEEAMNQVKSGMPDFNNNSIKDASAVIVTTVVANRSGYERDGSATTEFCHNEWGIYDLGMACQNLVLKAQDMGLGTLVMGIRDSEAVKTALGIPEDQIVVAVIGVGYPAVSPEMPKRKAVEDVLKVL